MQHVAHGDDVDRFAVIGDRDMAIAAAVHALQQPLTCTPCLEKRCPYPAALCMAQFKADQVLASLDDCLKVGA